MSKSDYLYFCNYLLLKFAILLKSSLLLSFLFVKKCHSHNETCCFKWLEKGSHLDHSVHKETLRHLKYCLEMRNFQDNILIYIPFFNVSFLYFFIYILLYIAIIVFMFMLLFQILFFKMHILLKNFSTFLTVTFT